VSRPSPDTAFGPIGISQHITIAQASARWALSTLAAAGPAIMLVGLSGAQGAWYVKFGSVTVTVSTTDGMRVVPGSITEPVVIPVPAGATHVAIICDGASGDAVLSCGGLLFGYFSPLGSGSQNAITSTDQRIALPTLGTPNPAIHLVGMQGQMGALWIKLGNSGVTGSLTTSHKYLPGSANKSTIIPVLNSETHLSVFCEGAGGNLLLHGGNIYSP
jgi:hypothetical protein